MMQNMGQKIVAAAAKKLAPTGGTSSHRPDLYLSDHQSVTTDSQRILIGWASTLETPCVEALENWVLGNFKGTVKIEHATLRYFPDEALASCVVGWLSPTRRLEDHKDMVRVAPNRYLEGGTKAVWEVRNAEDGTPYLVRTTAENLEGLLAERKKAARGGNGAKMASFSSLKNEGYLVVDPGDEIRFYYKGQTKLGHIKRFDGGEIVVASGKETFRIAAPAVVEVVTKDPKTVDDYKERVKQYWSKIFPPSYMAKWLK
jgi:hypothetical protein